MKNTEETPKKYGFWNWGTGIAITIVLSAAFILFLVYKTTTAHFEMVEDNYYEQESKFNHQLEASRNAAALSSSIAVNEDLSFVRIRVPRECVEQNATGKIWIYRPSSEKNDLHLDFTPDSNGEIFIDKDQLIKGVYRLKADWQMNGKDYHQEQSFYVENVITN